MVLSTCSPTAGSARLSTRAGVIVSPGAMSGSVVEAAHVVDLQAEQVAQSMWQEDGRQPGVHGGFR